MARAFETLTIDEIVEMNRQQIKLYGGSFVGACNFRNEASLRYALEAINAVVYGEELYPNIEEKAACLAYNIIAKHVFTDGNKRTGMAVCRVYLLLHDMDLRLDETSGFDDDLIQTAERIATGKIDFSDFADWIRSRLLDTRI